MKLIKSTLTVLMLGQLACRAEIIDNFSDGGWKLYPSTPGKLLVEKDKLVLEDQVGKPGWVTVAKTYEIDVDKTPLLVLKVSAVTQKGEVKVIRKKPFAKKSVLIISQPGTYSIDIAKQCGWQGMNKIDLLLYALGDGGKITFDYVKFTDKLNPQELKEIKKEEAKK